MKEYDHKKLEKKWQSIWEKKKIYQAQNSFKKPKYYSLIEFPYPSGDGLHVGHPRPYIGMDVISRKRRMEGFNVLYPIGWDAFGLPTENYAIKTGKDPRVVTKENTDTFRGQIKSLGISFDWSREINTTDPKYYKWTQWIFLQFLKKGLAYKAKMTINWCPKCKIGLANEEVVNNSCERCGTTVEKRKKEQWMLAITKYADRLDKDLDDVDYLPQIKLGQRNWIGRSEGAEIEFKITVKQKNNFGAFALGGKGQGTHDAQNHSFVSQSVKVFTTRPDTIFGVTFIALAPEIAKKLTGKDFGIKSDVDRENKQKIGVDTGLEAKNPANGEMIPVFAVNYVSAEYGTGAIMGVPAHDERDFEFAKKYNLPIKEVIEPVFVDTEGIDAVQKDKPMVEREAILAIVKHWSEDKYLGLKWKKVNWGTFISGGVEKGQTSEQAARAEIEEETGYFNLKLIKTLGRYHSKFFHTPKNENRFGHFNTFYFELENGKQNEISKEEKEKHEILWLSPKEIEKFLTTESLRYRWNILQGYKKIYTGRGILVNSGKFSGMDSEKAKKEIIKFVGGKEKTTFKLRDWIFSRQRYWGEPIPVIYCENCRVGSLASDKRKQGFRLENAGWIPVPEKDLPVELPKVKNYQPTDSGESPLANIPKWVNVKCPQCKGKAKRETDTMPNWAGSSWYYLRYTDDKNKKEFASQKNLRYWLGVDPVRERSPQGDRSTASGRAFSNGVDWYNGGNEHTTLHLLYSRFWHKFLFDLKLVPTNEPYMKRTSHGLILAEGGEKMSKSKGNVINPNDIVKIYGADTLRLYEMFMGPFDQAIAWSEEAIIGPRRFLEKVWRIGMSKCLFDKKSPMSKRHFDITRLLHKTIKKVSEDIEEMRFNTAISALMILATEMEKAEKLTPESYKLFLQILAPFAPHIAEELWQNLAPQGLAFGFLKARPSSSSIHSSAWPKWDENLIKDEEIKIIIQINGKVRTEIVIQADDKEEDVKKQALANEVVLRHTEGKEIKKTIYVKDRLINIVLSN